MFWFKAFEAFWLAVVTHVLSSNCSFRFCLAFLIFFNFGHRMGAGRKTQTFIMNGNSPSTNPTYTRASARNLGKHQLGGVIFGCKNNTIKECLTNQLFGQSSAILRHIFSKHFGCFWLSFFFQDFVSHSETSSIFWWDCIRMGRMNKIFLIVFILIIYFSSRFCFLFFISRIILILQMSFRQLLLCIHTLSSFFFKQDSC